MTRPSGQSHELFRHAASHPLRFPPVNRANSAPALRARSEAWIEPATGPFPPCPDLIDNVSITTAIEVAPPPVVRVLMCDEKTALARLTKQLRPSTHGSGGGTTVTIISTPQEYNEENLYVDLRSTLGRPLFLKCEGFNFAGSVKLKAATSMVEAAERDGLLRPGSVLVESSSG